MAASGAVERTFSTVHSTTCESSVQLPTPTRRGWNSLHWRRLLQIPSRHHSTRSHIHRFVALKLSYLLTYLMPWLATRPKSRRAGSSRYLTLVLFSAVYRNCTRQQIKTSVGNSWNRITIRIWETWITSQTVTDSL